MEPIQGVGFDIQSGMTGTTPTLPVASHYAGTLLRSYDSIVNVPRILPVLVEIPFSV
jgi:hypothetical protein